MSEQCSCDVFAPTLIFACSGGSDTPEIGDRAARKLQQEGLGRMYCLAGIGGNVDTIIENTRTARNVLVIDGCDTDCARKIMERAGFIDFKHLRVTDCGFEKGQTPPTDWRIETVTEKARALLESAS